MMNYEIFKEVVAEKFKEYLPQEYQHMEVRLDSVNKVNKVFDSLTLVDHSAERNVSPTLYLNDMYERYVDTEELQLVLQEAATTMAKAFENAPMTLTVQRTTLFFRLSIRCRTKRCLRICLTENFRIYPLSTAG